MNKQLKIWSLVLSMLAVIAMNSCSDDPPLPDNLTAFETATVGFEGTSKDIKVTLSRAESADVSVTISLTPTGVVYGTQFTTTPAATSNVLTLVIPAGSTEATFKVTKLDNVFLSGTESIDFTITGAADPIVLGEVLTTKLSFSAIVSDGSQLQLNGLIATEAGSNAGNSVFVDFSNNQQTPIARTSWDLGFYTGTDFRVVINKVSGASVIAVNKADLTQVTSADVDPNALKVGQGAGTLSLVDDVFGDITKTAIPAVSSTDSENKVYVINRVGGSGSVGATSDFIKVRILRTSGGAYTLQYAKIDETTFKTLTITKDATFNFKYVSFDNAAVNVEPEKAKWDIEWTWSMYYTQNPPPSGPNIPYGFSDLVFINHLNGTTAAEVITTNTSVTYDNFVESNLSTVTLKTERNVIGSNWRATTGTVGVKTDRFYVVKDPSGNVYKLKFVSFHASDGGTRGKPVIQYKLVKKAS